MRFTAEAAEVERMSRYGFDSWGTIAKSSRSVRRKTLIEMGFTYYGIGC